MVDRRKTILALFAMAVAVTACTSTVTGSGTDPDDGAAENDPAPAQRGGASSDASASADDAPTAKAVERVFVTGGRYSGNLGGLDGADALCSAAASKAKLGGTWKAWLSDASEDAIDRIKDVGPWYLVDRKTLVFKDKQAILAQPEHAIDLDESGAKISHQGDSYVPVFVWTSTTATGRLSHGAFDTNCKDWSTAADSEGGGPGNLTTTSDWSAIGSAGSFQPCSDMLRLYCFEQ